MAFRFFKKQTPRIRQISEVRHCLRELAVLIQTNSHPEIQEHLKRMLAYRLPEEYDNFAHDLFSPVLWDGRESLIAIEVFETQKKLRDFSRQIIRLNELLLESQIKHAPLHRYAEKLKSWANKIPCPVSETIRQKVESSIAFLIHHYGKDYLFSKRVLTPTPEDFNIRYDGSEKSIHETMNIVARQMDIDPQDIRLEFYSEGIRELNSGGQMNRRFFLGTETGEKSTGGLYWGKMEDNKYHVSINYSKLKTPENLVATLAHELSHIKLLGEGRMDKNDEFMTDLSVVIFGFGIFNANAAFQYFKSFDSYGYRSSGYLSQMTWGYALALVSFIRGDETPDWLQYLTPNIQSDFKKSMEYIRFYQEVIFEENKFD